MSFRRLQDLIAYSVFFVWKCSVPEYPHTGLYGEESQYNQSLRWHCVGLSLVRISDTCTRLSLQLGHSTLFNTDYWTLPKPFIRLLFHIYRALDAFVLLLWTSNFVKKDKFALHRLIILLICIDIQSNTSPYNCEITSLERLHLNTRSIRNNLEQILRIIIISSVFLETHYYKLTHFRGLWQAYP